MSSTIEKEVLSKVSDLGFAMPKGKSLAEAKEEDVRGLFMSLLSVYDTTWAEDTATKTDKQIRQSVMRYLRLLDLSHLTPSVESLRPGNPAVIRCLSAVVQKLEDKHGNKLKMRVRQCLKPKLSKSRQIVGRSPALKPQIPCIKETRTPVAALTNALSQTPASPTIKLLNGKPIVPGSELRGRELARSPPQGGAITPSIRKCGPIQESVADCSPALTTRRKSQRLSGPSSGTETELPKNNTHLPDQPPLKRSRNTSNLEAKVTDNLIPTGRQLGRTPPRPQLKLHQEEKRLSQFKQGDQMVTDKTESDSVEVAMVLNFEAEVETEACNTKELQTDLQPAEVEVKTLTKDTHRQERELEKKRRRSKRKSIVIPTHASETTPVALTCPENLKPDDNDKEFLQIQENQRKIKELNRESAAISKKIVEQTYQRDLLIAEYEEVVHDAKQIEDKIRESHRQVRRALSDHTNNNSPSTLAITTKKTLLTSVQLKMAAQHTRLRAQVQKENAQIEEFDNTLNNTAWLQTEKHELESAVKKLPSKVKQAESELAQAKNELEATKASLAPCSEQGFDDKRYTRRRLKALLERIKMAKERRVLLKQMNLR